MTVGAKLLTPEVLLSAPRRSPAVPNHDGSLALYSVSQYSFSSHYQSSEIRVLSLKTAQSKLLYENPGAKDPVWLGWENQVLWLEDGEQGVTRLVLGDANSPDRNPMCIATFNGPVSNLKICSLNAVTKAIAMSGMATPNGDLYNPETAEKPASTARVYSSLQVRLWDTYITENRHSIFYASLKRSHDCNGSHTMTTSSLVNALHGHHISLESPIPPSGGRDDFDISKNGLVFVAKDPKLNPALYHQSDVYYIPLKSFIEPQAPAPQKIKTGDLWGFSSWPVFSPDGGSVAFTKQKESQYYDAKTRLILIPDIDGPSNVQEFFETTDGKGGWHLKPKSIKFSLNGKELYVTARETGRMNLFKLPASPRHATKLPEALVHNGYVQSAEVFQDGRLLVSSTSFIDDSLYTILDPACPSESRIISSNSKQGKAFGLDQGQVEEIWYQGAGEYKVHAWIIKLPNFCKNKKHPLALLVHGGPYDSWDDKWNLRWNAALFAQQGYVVMQPNITGSSGYGMEFQDAVTNHWGGRPYEDLVRLFEHIEKHIPYIDTSRAIAAGASYGGYMMNWIQGQPLGKKFKALVCHDGIVDLNQKWATDILWEPMHEFGGTPPWENPEGYAKWNPWRFLGEWSTPMLVVHSERDYRCPIAGGLAAFHTLQKKGVESRFLNFEDEGHWVVKPENSLVWYKEVLDWINKYSGITAEEEGEEEIRKRLSDF